MLNQFNNLAYKQASLQSEVSTGLSVQAPSDDPGAMQNTLQYLTETATQKQYGSNIKTLQTRATSIDSVLQSLQTITSRAGEIATSGASGTSSQTDLGNYADEVNKLINQVVTAANTKDSASSQYLFGGTAATAAPFTTTTDANGNVTAVTYNGNSSVNQSEIGVNLTTSVDVPGVNTDGSGARGLITDQQSGADLINHLISLRNDLDSGDTTTISSTDSANLQLDENNVAYQVANNGVVQNQLTVAATFATNSTSNLNTMISDTSSANMVTTMVQLNQAQTAYQAALESSVKIMNLSLLNYLS